MDEPGFPVDGSIELLGDDSVESESVQNVQENKADISEKAKNIERSENINDVENNPVSDKKMPSERKVAGGTNDVEDNQESQASSDSTGIEEKSCKPEAEENSRKTFVKPEEDVISDGLKGLSIKMDDLQEEFSRKLKYDAHKEKLIDSLHKELQLYKNDLVKKHVQSIIMDVIKIIDDLRKLSEHYHTYSPEEIEVEKLLRIFDRIPSDLEDIFFYQGVVPFECGGVEFDPKRQRILKNIETFDQSKDKMIAESIRPGYEWKGKILRPEIVAVYHYKELTVTVEENQEDIR